jgi:hypothetical protein
MFKRLSNQLSIFALIFFAPDLAAADGLRTCAVQGVEGNTAQYWQDGVWSPIENALEISADAKIATGPDARVKIVCDDGIIVTIGSGTEVNLEQLAGLADLQTNIFLQLIDGIIAIVAPTRSWGRFEVRTPVAIASVRSTEWLVENDPADGAAVFVRAGTVVVRIQDGRQVRLGRGEGISVSADGVAGETKQWGAARIARSTAALGFDW